MVNDNARSIFQRILAEDADLISQLSDAFKLLPDIAVVEAASDRVDGLCSGCTFRDGPL